MMKDGQTKGQPDHGGEVDRIKQPMETEEEEEEEGTKSSICCLQGCLAATAVGFGFFVALPTGILLVIYATNNDDVPLLSVGAVLVCLPLLMLIFVIVLCFNQRRLARLGKNRVTSARKRKAASSSTSSSSTTTMVETTVSETGDLKTGAKGETCCTGVGLEKERY